MLFIGTAWPSGLLFSKRKKVVKVRESIEVARWWYNFLNNLVPSSMLLQSIP